MKAIYVKKAVSNQQFSSYYEKHPSYTLLESREKMKIIGFTFVQDQPLPHHLEECNEQEQAKCEAYFNPQAKRPDPKAEGYTKTRQAIKKVRVDYPFLRRSDDSENN